MARNDPQYTTGVERRPQLDKHMQSNVRGLHIVGAANGSPLLKTCINEGVQVIRSLSRLMPPGRIDDEVDDLIIIGAGPAGLSAAMEARKRGYRFSLLEQGRPLGTILNFPAGKRIYAEPVTMRSLGDLDFDDSTKEELLVRWGEQIRGIEIIRGANATEIRRVGDRFTVATQEGARFEGRRVILATGRMGNPRKLGVEGEDLSDVYTVLLNPGKYKDKEIVVVGGGNSAAEGAIALAPANRVTIVHRADGFHRVSPANRARLRRAEREQGLRILLQSSVKAFRAGEVDVETNGAVRVVKRDAAFVLIGADPPTTFLKRLGVRLAGEWTWGVVPKIAWVFAMVYAIYGIKFGLWPFGATYQALKDAGADPGLLYGILYTALVTIFGTRAIRKYRADPYQTKRYATLIACQFLVYFLLPWGLYYAHYSEWWRTWGVSLTYPLGYYALWEPAGTLFAGTSLPWAVAAIIAFLIAIPIFSAYHGKRFCAWICPCGGMADTVGDGFRTKSPRGAGIRRLETAETVVLAATIAASVYLISGYRSFLDPLRVQGVYKSIVDIGLASLVAITLYPFAGNRIWCRFFCPLAKWMELWGRWTGGKLRIVPNDECISCGECTRYCQMGIDVRAFAQREEPLSNRTTCCIFCGICVTVCPVDVLRLERDRGGRAAVGEGAERI